MAAVGGKNNKKNLDKKGNNIFIKFNIYMTRENRNVLSYWLCIVNLLNLGDRMDDTH